MIELFTTLRKNVYSHFENLPYLFNLASKDQPDCGDDTLVEAIEMLETTLQSLGLMTQNFSSMMSFSCELDRTPENEMPEIFLIFNLLGTLSVDVFGAYKLTTQAIIDRKEGKHTYRPKQTDAETKDGVK